MIKVLWIDDECRDEFGELTEKGLTFVEYAYDKEIDITAVTTYVEGIKLIKSQPLGWCAVILDIREQRATEGNAADGYLNARREIERFQAERHQKEPYIFTLSGEKRYHELDSLIPKEGHCSKRVYDKNHANYKILFDDIRKIRELSELYKLQEEYAELLNIASKLGEEADSRLFSIMYPIFVLNETKDPKWLNEIRKYLEKFVFPCLKEKKFFPDSCTSMNECSSYIGKESEAPEYIKRSFHSLIRIVQEGSHGKTDSDNDVRYGQAPYLLKSCIFELLNIVYWIKSV